MSAKPVPEIKGMPFIGIARSFIEDPADYLVEQVAERDIVFFRLFGMPVFTISDPDLIHEVLVSNYRAYRKSDRTTDVLRRFIGEGLVTYQDFDEHRHQRRLAQPAFHMRRVAAYADVMVEYAAQMVDAWQPGEVRDIADEMMALTMYIVSKTLFDVDKAEMVGSATAVGEAVDEIQGLTNQMLNAFVLWPEWLPTSTNRRGKRARAVLDETIDRIMAERRGANGKIVDTGDLLSMYLLAEHEDGSRMDDRRVRDEMITLFTAGHETTSNALTWAFYLISQHPEVEAKLYAELDAVLHGRVPTFDDLPQLPYTEMVIKETLRLYPPVWALVGRQANADTMLADYQIPKDSLVFILPYLTHQLSRFFPEPERFDPERFTPEREAALPKFAYLPFGGGPRVCIGNSFALMEARLILATVAQRFRLALARPQPIKPNAQVTLSPLGGMAMKLVARETAVEAA